MSTQELRTPEIKPQERAALLRSLRELVRIPSPNPGGSEAAVAAYVAERLRACDAEVRLVPTLPGRCSVGARIVGGRPGPSLLLNGHMDTVPPGPAESWSSDPYEPVERDGWIYGRGACDMKAGLAISLRLAELVAAKRARLRGSLVLHFAVGEECAEPGTSSLLRAGYVGDVGIVLEPTLLRVATAERGRSTLFVTIRGKAGHPAAPDPATNPLLRVPAVLEAIGERHRELAAHTHPLLPAGSVTPTTIQGGISANVVPDSCTVSVDCRLLPGQSGAAIREALTARLEALEREQPGCTYEVRCDRRSFPSAETPDRTGFAHHVLRVAEPWVGTREPWGTPYASDVGHLVNDGGVEAVTFGPGDIRHCHGPDERIAVDQIAAAADVVATVTRELLLGEPPAQAG